MTVKRTAFAWSPVRKLMKKAGATIVSRDAVNYLVQSLEKYSIEMTTKALKFANHSGRKKISKEDIVLAQDYM